MIAISDSLTAAAAAYRRGDFGTARRQGEAALRTQPNNPAILQLLGVVCCQTGDVARGADYIRRAIDAGADTPDNRFNLARALVDLGRLDEAAALCAQPGATPELQRLHADILKALGRVQEAVWSYEGLVAANPNDAESWNNLGNARHQSGDFDGALDALQRARALSPDSATIHTNIGRLFISMDRYQEACLMLEQAVLRAPKDPQPLLELGRALISIDHAASGLRALGDAARLNPKDPKIFIAMGLAFSDLGDLRKAEQAIGFALKADPGFAPAYLDLGILLEKENRLEELDRLLAQADARRVSGPEIDYLRALSLSRKDKAEEALALARSVQSRAIHPATVAHFVGQLADRLNRVDEAFTAFEEMNLAAAQSPLGVGVDREAYQRGIDGLARQTTAEWFAGWAKESKQPERPSPVFLVGFPRSGTTLLDTILMGQRDTHVLEEVPILETVANEIGDFTRIGSFGEAEIAAVRARYFAELDRLSPPPPGKLVIDKNPLSMLRVPLIHRIFPDARIILTLRHPCDVVLSCFMQNFKVTEAMASFLDLTNAARTYDRIFSYWEQCRNLFPIRVHSIAYEAMIEDLEGEMKPLLEFLDLPWDPAILDHQRTAKERGYIRTPSYAQVTEGIYRRASGRWTRYRRHMEPILPILAPWADKFGYSLD